MADQTLDALRLRFLTLIDEFTREAIWIQTAWLLNSHDLVRVLGLVCPIPYRSRQFIIHHR